MAITIHGFSKKKLHPVLKKKSYRHWNTCLKLNYPIKLKWERNRRERKKEERKLDWGRVTESVIEGGVNLGVVW